MTSTTQLQIAGVALQAWRLGEGGLLDETECGNMSCTHNINTFTSTLGVAVLNDHIYAVGGFDGSCGLNTAEVTVEHGD